MKSCDNKCVTVSSITVITVKNFKRNLNDHQLDTD